ncbi:ImmA/IrrE family metallo-endopeptidase [Streptococcus uberis]|uniref:ImmA/IrrE family metallo-endopeptidase n=1 Tax=Streptococcus uberis TaxID=1349 RepID=UPI00214FFF45|nr:ImmA/IrrE family metallo-endopeptidase [Streptococcus uberis]MCR4258714.1 ImmA/IrrE family metallo-endopeptidase [Streptococcus uberis]
MTVINYFDGRETGKSGFYNQPFDAVFINAYLDEIDKKKALYHELGHVGQYFENYDRLKEKFEAQADRNMIHHLLKEYLTTLDDISDFNVCRFMELYRLKTICNEQMIIDELNNFI